MQQLVDHGEKKKQKKKAEFGYSTKKHAGLRNNDKSARQVISPADSKENTFLPISPPDGNTNASVNDYSHALNDTSLGPTCSNRRSNKAIVKTKMLKKRIRFQTFVIGFDSAGLFQTQQLIN